ncbi:MAG: type II/IV secretion system ATPase subunit [Clostridia bacterium]|nr:type II/IV secretion system ATPase subunit [Clostridia bacterium]
MQKTLPQALELVQSHITQDCPRTLEQGRRDLIRAEAERFIRETKLEVPGFDDKTLCDRILCEMLDYSLLTAYLGRNDIEEINVNAWDDIAITYTDGHTEKLRDTFFSPLHATDVVRRLLHHSGMVIDGACPVAQGHLPGHIRVTALRTPVVDEETGIAVSIRHLHPGRTDRGRLIKNGMADGRMMDFLEMCLRYGVSLVIAGRTSSGKTTLLNALLESVPDAKRVYSIESGARELSLVRRDASGKIVNNVVQTLSRPSDNPAYNVSQEDLVTAALRFDPDLIVVGEIRDAEAHAAVEASLTGHTVASTVHAGPGALAHNRIALLCQRRFQLGMDISLQQARQAFPVVVFCHYCEDGVRRIMDISEAVSGPEGSPRYRTLYKYAITGVERHGSATSIRGRHEFVCPPSLELQELLTRSGAPDELLTKLLKGVS